MTTREEMIAALRESPSEAKPTREQMIASLKSGSPSPEQQLKEEPGMAMQALDYGLRGLDALGGAARFAASGYGELYNLATGKPGLNKPDEIVNVLKGQAPTTEDYLDRSGMEDGWGRTLLGVGGDMALDPLTYLSGGAAAAGKLSKLRKIFNPISGAMEGGGKKLIRSGVKTIDQDLVDKGVPKLSDLLIEKNITGTNKQIAKKLEILEGKVKAKRAKMFDEVAEAGGEVDTGKILDEFVDYSNKTVAKSGNEKAAKAASKLSEELLDILPNQNKMGLEQASHLKSKIRDGLSDSILENSRVKNQYKAGVKKMGDIFQKSIEEAGEKVIPGMGKKISKTNKEWSTLISAEPLMKKEIRKGVAKNLFTPVDALAVGGGYLSGMDRENTAGFLALKKAADLSKTTGARTTAGKLMRLLGKLPTDALVRRGAISKFRSDPEPQSLQVWENMNKTKP